MIYEAYSILAYFFAYRNPKVRCIETFDALSNTTTFHTRCCHGYIFLFRGTFRTYSSRTCCMMIFSFAACSEVMYGFVIGVNIREGDSPVLCLAIVICVGQLLFLHRFLRFNRTT